MQGNIFSFHVAWNQELSNMLLSQCSKTIQWKQNKMLQNFPELFEGSQIHFYFVQTTSPTQIQSRTIEHSIILIADAFYSVDLSVWTIKSVSLHMSIIYLKSLKIQRKSKMLRRQVRDCLVVSDMAMWISSRDQFYKQTSVKMARFISQQTRMMQGRGNKGVWQLT